MQEGVEFAALTDIIYKTWADKTAKEYKKFKGLKKENLRDNMTNKELVLNMLLNYQPKKFRKQPIRNRFWNIKMWRVVEEILPKRLALN